MDLLIDYRVAKHQIIRDGTESGVNIRLDQDLKKVKVWYKATYENENMTGFLFWRSVSQTAFVYKEQVLFYQITNVFRNTLVELKL